jgi:hypothetical protein
MTDDTESSALPNIVALKASEEWLYRHVCWDLSEAYQAYRFGSCHGVDASEMRKQLKFKRHFPFFDVLSAEVTSVLLQHAISHVVAVANRQEDWDGGDKMRSEWAAAREHVLDQLIQSGVSNMTETNRSALAARADELFEQVFRHSVHLDYE